MQSAAGGERLASCERSGWREIVDGGRSRGTEQEGQVKYKFTTTRADHTLEDCNLDFPRIAGKRGERGGTE